MGRQRWGRGALICLGWTLVGLFFGSQLYLLSALGFGMPMSWGRAFASGLADWYIWGALAPLVFWSSRRFRLGRGNWPVRLLLHLVSSVLIALLQLVLSTAFAQLLESFNHRPFPFLMGLRFALAVKFHWNVLIYFAILGLSHALAYFRESRESELRATQLQSQLVQAQLQSLKTRLHPHFLFNSLNTISQLIFEEPESADRMITHLSELLRISLEASSAQEVPLRQELDILQRYLEIQKVRFGDRLTTLIDIDPGVCDALVPNLILQPLVENAIRHGIGPRSVPGRIEIHAQPQGPMLCLRISDNGVGLPKGSESSVKDGVGLGTTRERLQYLYGTAQSLALSSVPGGGLVITLVIPMRTSPLGIAPSETESNGDNQSADS